MTNSAKLTFKGSPVAGQNTTYQRPFAIMPVCLSQYIIVATTGGDLDDAERVWDRTRTRSPPMYVGFSEYLSKINNKSALKLFNFATSSTRIFSRKLTLSLELWRVRRPGGARIISSGYSDTGSFCIHRSVSSATLVAR